jgi:cytochrome P450
MDMFVSEVLRMYPIGVRSVERRATEDTVVQGIKIDKGNYMFLCQKIISFIFDYE